MTGGDTDAIRQGAINGGFGYWFNEQLHYVQTPDGQMTVESPGERYDMSGAFEMMPGVMAIKCMVDGCTPFEMGLAAIEFVPIKVPGAGKAAGAVAEAIGFGESAIATAFQGMRGGGGHAVRHLMDEGLIANAGPLAQRAEKFLLTVLDADEVAGSAKLGTRAPCVVAIQQQEAHRRDSDRSAEVSPRRPYVRDPAMG